MIFKPEWGLFSALALILWVPFGLWLFTRQRPTRAAANVMVWGMMWLPDGAGFDFPLLPPLDKHSICALVALLGVWWKAPGRLRAARLGSGLDWFAFAMLLGLIGTVATNGDPLNYGVIKVTSLPAYTAYDGLSTAIRLVITILIPCWLGRSLLRSKQDLFDVLKLLTAAGLAYSVPIIWELRMSPMLQHNLYGFTSRTDWQQNMRQGGWRPTVFMGHGLLVGFFMFVCTTAAVILQRTGRKRLFIFPMWSIVGYLFVMLVLCKAMGALLYGLVAFALLRWLSAKAQMRVLLVFAVIVAAYPISRMLELFPVKEVMGLAEMLGPERAQSMQFRFDNEDILLIKGAEKIWFGWGGFARDRVYDSFSGKDIVIQDGYWIAVFGQMGLTGFLGFFSLMLIPILRARSSVRNLRDKADRTMLGGLAIMVTICAINLLPNMALPNLQLFFAAGLSVLARNMPLQSKMERTAPKTTDDPPKAPRPRRPAEERLAAFRRALKSPLES